MMADTRYWSKEFVSDFIAIYKENPCLWRIKSKEYTNKKLKSEAYDKLVLLCKTIYQEANRDFVVKKIQSLRGSFRKELKKVEESKRSGNSQDVYVPSLWYYDLLLFTKDQELPSVSISNVDCTEDENNFHCFHLLEGRRKSDDEIISEQQSDDTEPFSKPSTNTEKLIPSSTPQKEKRKLVTDGKSSKSIRVCTTSLIANNDVNEYEAIGINVAKKLQRMNAKQAIYAESLINTVLKRGLLKTLYDFTDLCDNLCTAKRLNNVQIPAVSPATSNESASNDSYTFGDARTIDEY